MWQFKEFKYLLHLRFNKSLHETIEKVLKQFAISPNKTCLKYL